MQKEKRWISSDLLFTAISEQLAQNRQAAFTVTGMSMWPLICHGRDQVIVEQANRDTVHKGDIILYQVSESHYVLHRVTRLEKNRFQTTGDGNLRRDPMMPYDSIMAKVTKISRNGKMIDCNAPQWKFLFRIWMVLFPMRRMIFGGWFRIRKYIRP